MKLKPFCPNYHILTSSIVLTLNLASLSFKRSCFNGNPKDKTGHFGSLFLFFKAFSIYTGLLRSCNISYFSSYRIIVINYCFTVTWRFFLTLSFLRFWRKLVLRMQAPWILTSWLTLFIGIYIVMFLCFKKLVHAIGS